MKDFEVNFTTKTTNVYKPLTLTQYLRTSTVFVEIDITSVLQYKNRINTQSSC